MHEHLNEVAVKLSLLIKDEEIWSALMNSSMCCKGSRIFDCLSLKKRSNDKLECYTGFSVVQCCIFG